MGGFWWRKYEASPILPLFTTAQALIGFINQGSGLAGLVAGRVII